MRSVRLIAFKFAVAASALAGILAVAPAVASADAVSDLYGAEYDRVAVLEAGDDSFEPEAAAADDVAADGTDAGVALLDAGQIARPLSPRDVSPEMLYFCKWESGQNYDQGLSSGDGYHAMGYFQFDNRYDLGPFLYSVYCYNPTKYSTLKVLGDKYEWNVNRDTRKGGDFTEFGKDLNAAWHACYKADPTEFSGLQNDWAYTQYFDSSDGIRGSLIELGINIDDRSDSVKSLVWGMANLFGKGGGKYEIRNGNYWGAIWFIKNSGINGSMDDETLVTTLCDYVINNVARRYPSQPQYHQGWQNRYRDEKMHYLSVIKEAAATNRKTLDALAATNRDAVADGMYVIRALCSSGGVLDVARASTSNGANVCIWDADSSDSQRWIISHDSAGYITLTNAASGKVLDVAWGVGREGDNVDQWSANGGWNQKWIAVPDSTGGVRLVSAMRSNLVLDVYRGLSDSGTNVQVWGSNSGSSQSFKFEAAKTQRQTLDDLAAENRDEIADGTYVVKAACSDRGVLDVYGGYTDNGRNVQIWTSNPTDGQRWVVSHDDAGYVTLTNAASGKVLDVAWGVGREGDNVDQWAPNGGWNQKWVAVPDSRGGVTLVSAIRPDRVLDVYYGRSEAGTNVQLWSANGGVSQSFNFIKAYPSVPTSDEGVVDENAWYDIVPECAPDKALDIHGASRATGANVDTWNANGTVGQAFRFEFHDGYYLIINAGSGLALDVANSDVIPGGNVSQWPSDATRANRLFSICSNGDGTVSLVNKATGLAVNVSGGSSAAGTNVDVWTPDGSSAQRFRLVKRDRLVSAGTYTISLAMDSSLVLDLANSSPNDNASILAWRSSGALNQRWLITPVGGQPNDVYAIESLSSSKRLTADGNGVVQRVAKDDSTQWWRIIVDSGAISFESVSNPGIRLSVDASFGANAGLSPASSAASQRFALMPTDGMLPSGTYYIRAASAPSQVLDVERGSMADCASVLAWANNGGGNQKWNITHNSDGTYTFKNCATGKVLDVENGVAAPGTNVLQYTANGGKNQRWNMTYREGGYVISSALDSSLVLTFSGGTASGSNACVDVDSSSAGQRFTFGPTTYLPPAEQAMTLKAQGYHSSTSWLILVDITQNRVGIFNGSMGNWKLQNFWLCSSGAPNSSTRVGQFTVGNKGYSFGEEHGYSCYYWTQFYADYLFHSVKYYAGTRNIMDGRLGMNISAGCVRMQIDQAKWIYDNIPRGTKVIVYR